MDEIINKKIQLTLYALMFKIVLAFWSKQTLTSFGWTKLNSKIQKFKN